MEVRNCLNVLVAGTAPQRLAGMSIRNSPTLQHQCWQNKIGLFTREQKEACASWKRCIVKESEKEAASSTQKKVAKPTTKFQLTTYLEAALGREASHVPALVAAASGTCFNPEVDDPETVECDCFEVM